MNMKQPRAQHNYTEMGFKHLKLPKDIWDPLLEFYEKHKPLGETDSLTDTVTHIDLCIAKPENWGGRGNTYVNHWESPTTMVNFEDFPDGPSLKNFIWDKVQPIIEEWVGRKVKPT
jgi:hypothetical protein